MTDEQIAQAFHEALERVEESYGPERLDREGPVSWEDVSPIWKRQLVATVAELRRRGVIG